VALLTTGPVASRSRVPPTEHVDWYFVPGDSLGDLASTACSYVYDVWFETAQGEIEPTMLPTAFTIVFGAGPGSWDRVASNPRNEQPAGLGIRSRA